jgi:hypothetical protein
MQCRLTINLRFSDPINAGCLDNPLRFAAMNNSVLLHSHIIHDFAVAAIGRDELQNSLVL